MTQGEHTPDIAVSDDTAQGQASACGCDSQKIAAVHRYFEGHFRGFKLRDFHAPVRLMQAGLPSPHGEHHVVSIERPDGLPYCVVLLNEFLARPAEQISETLRQWNVVDVLQAHRIAVLEADVASAL